MNVVRKIRDMQSLADRQRAAGKKLALIPTMGALHHGHLELVREARRSADHVTVSIFVNPAQFDQKEDFDTYPREPESDVDRLRELGLVDVVFMPGADEMYPQSMDRHMTWVTVDRLSRHLCGAYRTGHFRGVTTVVSKLFNACKPHLAVFGAKDAQQLLILKRMARELNFDVDVVGAATVRERDGLASSSRNVLLTDKQRAEAPVIYEALQEARALVEGGERNADAIRSFLRNAISRPTEGQVQYADVVDVDELQPLSTLPPGDTVLIAVAVFFGATRLIDNVFVEVPAND